MIDLQDLTVLEVDTARWDAAYRLWLDGQASAHTRRAYARAIQDCVVCCALPPWEMGRADIAAWVQDMRLRSLAGTTISQRLAAVSSFFRFVCEEYTDGKDRPLHDHNPAAGKRLRPRVTPYGKAGYLSAEQARKLLKTIPTETLHGKQDYALFCGYLFTARRNSEWRTARLDQFVQHGERVRYRFDAKGKRDQMVDVAPPVWEAVQRYQDAAGLREGYLFRALSEQARNLPTVGADWQPKDHPISAYEVGRRLKRYARKAGLRVEGLHVHTLRHTGAMLRRAAGDDVQEISAFLGHSSLAITQIYVQMVEGRRDESWQSVAELLL